MARRNRYDKRTLRKLGIDPAKVDPKELAIAKRHNIHPSWLVPAEATKPDHNHTLCGGGCGKLRSNDHYFDTSLCVFCRTISEAELEQIRKAYIKRDEEERKEQEAARRWFTSRGIKTA